MSFIQRNSKKCFTIAIAGALAFCLSFLITAFIVRGVVGKMESDWIEVDALIVGMKTYVAGGDGAVKKYYCPQVEFKSQAGKIITKVSRTSCVVNVDQWTDVIGSYLPIVYNPENPEDFIEQEDLQTHMETQVIVEASGGSISIILCCILYRLLQRQRRDQPRPADIPAPPSTRPTTTIPPEERKERILSRLYLMTVPEDSCRIAASSIRSMGRLDSSEKSTEGSEDSENGDHDNNETEQTQEDSTTMEDGSKIAASSIRSMGSLNSTEKTIEGSEDSENGDSEYSENGDSEYSENGDYSSDEEEESREDDSSTVEERQYGVSSTISSFWSNLIRSRHDEECCICLECYEPGEVVCASKSEECNHVFHKECLMVWMMKNNDRCPLCRVDFMKDEEEGNC